MGLSKKAAKAKELPVKKSIVQWCKELHEGDNELTMRWEGGGDSGWVYFEIDGETVDNEYTRALVDRMDDVLDYGSWAGEFQASGSATYNPETNSFEGIDHYGEDQGDYLDIDFTVKIPKKFWFETLHVEIEKNYDDGSNMSVRFIIKNGFITDQHTDFCRKLEETLSRDFDDLFDSYESRKGYDFRSCNYEWILEKTDAVENENAYIFKLKQVEFSVMSNDEKHIVLQLDEETAEFIDEQLNDVE
jgi:hypothetical protein